MERKRIVLISILSFIGLCTIGFLTYPNISIPARKKGWSLSPEGVARRLNHKDLWLDAGLFKGEDIININYLKTHPLVESARKQIGLVTKYDTSYHQGAYPPKDSGACTDVVEVALRDNDYLLKELLDRDMLSNPELYPSEYDPNINFRRVKNLKVFLDRNAISLSTCTEDHCFSDGLWQPGDIVTYEQIPGGLWHVAIVSNKVKVTEQGSIPFLIHNHGFGVVENDLLLSWPAPISGHYRILDRQDS